MATVHITTFFKPGRSHLASFEIRAKKLLDFKILEAMPVITVQDGYLKGFWTVVIECTEADRKVWFGFMEGVDLCVNQPSLMVGTDE